MILEVKNNFDFLIEKIGKKIGINLSYFAKHSFGITLRYLFVGFFGVLLTVSFARISTKEIFGQFQYIISFLGIVSVFSLPGLNMLALRETANGNDGALTQSVKKSFQWSWLGVPIIIGYGIYILTQGEYSLGGALISGGIIFPFYYASNTWYVFYEGKSNFNPVTIRVILSTIVVNLALIAGLFLKLNLVWIVVAYLGLSSVFNWIYYWEAAKRIKKATKPLDIKYGIACTIQKFTLSLTNTLPQIFISFMFGFELLAVFQVANLSISLISGFLSSLAATYIPLLFKYEKLNYKKFAIFNIAIGVVVLFGLLIFLKIFFLWFYGQQYKESYNLALAFSLIVVVYPLKIFLTNYFTSKNKNNLIIFSNIIANIAGPALLLLTRSHGFSFAVIVYFYTLNLVFIFPLFISYFSIASRKIDSILLEPTS